jgi:hypothetical protein
MGGLLQSLRNLSQTDANRRLPMPENLFPYSLQHNAHKLLRFHVDPPKPRQNNKEGIGLAIAITTLQLD